jgi:hypothetical protein
MASETHRFCSPLLVNALLSVGCVSVRLSLCVCLWLTRQVLPPRPSGTGRVLESRIHWVPVSRRSQTASRNRVGTREAVQKSR